MPRPSLCFGQGRRIVAPNSGRDASAEKTPEPGPKGNAVSGPVTASIAGLAVRLGALAGRRPGEGAGEWEEWRVGRVEGKK